MLLLSPVPGSAQGHALRMLLLLGLALAGEEEEEALVTSEANKLSGFRLLVLPEPDNPMNVLVKRVDDVLNLTCLLDFTPNMTMPANLALVKYDLAWYLPFLSQNSQNRVSKIKSVGVLQLIVHGLQETDSGDYKCEATGPSGEGLPSLHRTVRVEVKPKKGSCSQFHFHCPSGECILQRYVCDGVSDCKDGVDESNFHCGTEACRNKQRCPDGRCIPKAWCCDRYTDPNCTVQVLSSCCVDEMDKTTVEEIGMTGGGYRHIVPPPSHHYNDMVVFQTTVYTIIGCAMAFLFIVTIVGIAICRVHIKRSIMSRHPLRHLRITDRNCPPFSSAGNTAPSPSAYSDWDVYLQPPPAAERPRGLLVTYNINNGVQYVNGGHPMEPPPYCEVLTIPPREGPPPPYRSTESLNQQRPEATDPLLAEEPTNNNGDVNGNDTEGVQVEADGNVARTHTDV